MIVCENIRRVQLHEETRVTLVSLEYHNQTCKAFYVCFAYLNLSQKVNFSKTFDCKKRHPTHTCLMKEFFRIPVNFAGVT